jgi:uncharacterized protein YhaN
VLDRELREAERMRDAAQSAERERRRFGKERDGLRGDLDSLQRRVAALEGPLAALGGGDPRRGAEVAKARIEAHRRAGELSDELERAHPDLPDLIAHLDAPGHGGEAWAVDDHELAARRAHIDELEGDIERLIAEAKALERNAAHLREMETVDAIDGEIASLHETEAALVRERDRKWILAQVVRQADRRFREEHQPDLIRRASGHLEHLTGGRYDRLLVDEAHSDGLFLLMGPGLPAPVALAPPVSSGTLEQAYLSLRLAIVDHLDQGQERLPLFIDEAFVNWDRSRRDRGLDVLADLAAARQIFVFTCHPGLARALRERGAHQVALERDA